MNISSRDDRPRFNVTLGRINPGECLEFEKVPHQKHADGSIFLVLKVPTQYIDRVERRCGINDYRIMVANLATGSCSLVSSKRLCRYVDAEVVKL